ncbi:bifunctional 2-polyprenyl-6-hydroxyphenol methylase/3-demethylubiquinol 3-O-methyltransferase UbiG [Amycolatopsis sp. EV170708-02-1]|uniref:class I SAM-dependent methyltransferase n=1 Tax=Amycolatopsis sp. EV170708-02-1 TaxID=2919322 RepID=UPI001F0CA54D|nr:class I SAM-dependent methyltransferase [Amycolatopsis sp. EV170708-02-1]UMP05140.1 methyltransferase domain-containing protein [Amycolatopsis sp. EV170708-02-1]
MLERPPSREVSVRSISALSKEWDQLASIRHQELQDGSDVSFSEVLVPELLKQIRPAKPRSILDFGCGTGVLTEILASQHDNVVGVDPSSKSIQIAQGSPQRKAQYHLESIESYAQQNRSARFDAIVGNMTIMDVPDLRSALTACHQLCRDGGLVCLTLTHPNFWPTYWEYDSEEWFDYGREIFIEAEFKITKHHSGLYTTHVHRPLSMYIATAAKCGLSLLELTEPLPSKSTESLYGIKWKFPRFLILTFVRRSEQSDSLQTTPLW